MCPEENWHNSILMEYIFGQIEREDAYKIHTRINAKKFRYKLQYSGKNIDTVDKVEYASSAKNSSQKFAWLQAT